MSFMHQEVKYRGMEPVMGFHGTQGQPRPGLIEANGCVKRLLSRAKTSLMAVISCSSEGGVQCVDTTYNPPQVILNNSVYEIAHCGVDLSKPKMFSIIVGKKGGTDFFCHVFKCSNRDQASRFVRAVATACTLAYQSHQRKEHEAKAAAPRTAAAAPRPAVTRAAAPSRSAPKAATAPDSIRSAHTRASMRRPVGSTAVPGRGKPNPKLTDSWFRPSMSRGEVTTILRAGHIGDFLIRESQTRPNDYAISLQTGNQIWTGLVIRTPTGYQLGERGAVRFEELTELVAFYSQNQFMNDANGYPLTLRLPSDTAWISESQSRQAPVSRGSGFGRSVKAQPRQARPTASGRRGIPTFEEIMNGEAGMPDSEDWPASSEEDEDDGDIAFVPGQMPRTDEEAFAMFMDQGGFDVDEDGQLVPMADLGDALPHEEEDDDDDDDDDDFVPGEAPGSAPAPTHNGFGDDFGASAAQQAPSSGFDGAGFDDAFDPRQGSAPKVETLESLSDKIFATLASDAEGLVGGADVRPVLLKSSLDVSMLGVIWGEVDTDRRGSIDSAQLTMILGLIAQAQRGEEPSLETLDLENGPVPDLGSLDEYS